MKIDFINDLEPMAKVLVKYIYFIQKMTKYNHSFIAILDEGTDGLLSETIAHNNFKGKFLDSFFIHQQLTWS